MKRTAFIVGLVLSLIPAIAPAQRTNTFYADQFPGPTVGQMITQAMAQCNPSSTIPCFIVLNPTLVNYATGTIPTLPSNVFLEDYRAGLPGGGGSATLPANSPLVGANSAGTAVTVNPNASNSPVASATAVTANIPVTKIATSGWSAYLAFGTSLTCGYGGAGTGACSTSGYVNDLDAAIGSPALTNVGTQSDMAADTFNKVLNTVNPVENAGRLFTLEDFTNDYEQRGTGEYEFVAMQNDQASLLWLSTPSVNKTGGSTVTCTNWSTDTTYAALGLKSTTNGAACAFPYTTTVAGQGVAILYRIIDGNGGYFSYTDSGGAAGGTADDFTCTATGIGACINTVNGATYGGGVIYLSNLNRAPGTYSVTITPQSATGAGNIVSIIAILVAPPPATGNPQVWRQGVPRQVNAALNEEVLSSLSAEYNLDAQIDVQTVEENGWLGANFNDTRNCLFGTTGDMYNFLHPNAAGYSEWANCALAPAAQRPWPITGSAQNTDPTQWGSSTVYANFQTNTSYYLDATDKLATFAGTASGTAWLPVNAPQGKTIEIANLMGYASGLTVTVGCQIGIQQALPCGAVIMPQQVATLQLEHAGGDWQLIGLSPIDPTQYGTFKNAVVTVTGTAATLTCNVQAVFTTGSSNTTLTVPTNCPPNKFIDVYNTVPGMVVSYAGASGGTLNSHTMTGVGGDRIYAYSAGSWYAWGIGGGGIGAGTAGQLGFYQASGNAISPLSGNANIALAQIDLEVPSAPFATEICTGDSITQGTGASSQADDFCTVLANALFAQNVDNGLGGHQTGDLTVTIYGYNVPSNSRSLYTYMLGTNDVSFWGNVANAEANFQLEQEAQVAWNATPASVKKLATAATITGTWSAGTYYTGIEEMSTVSGSTITFSGLSGTTVCVATTMLNGNAGTATWTIDATSEGSLPFVGVGGQSLTTNIGLTSGPALTCVTGLSNTAHTAVVTVTSSSGTVYVDWAAAYSAAGSGVNANWPYVIYDAIPAENPVDTVTPVYNTYVASTASTLQGYGLTNVLYNNDYPVLNSPGYFFGNLHPNDDGFWLLAQSEYNTLATTTVPLPPFTPFTGGILYNNTPNAQNSLSTGYLSQLNATGSDNTAFGFEASAAITTGTDNTGFGNTALTTETTGNYNTAIGSKAGYALNGGANNTAIGYGALFSETTVAVSDTAIGEGAMLASNGATQTTAVGVDAAEAASGIDNVAVGWFSLKTASTGGYNTALGTQALQNNTGSDNTASGYGALFGVTTATFDEGDGYEAGFDLTTGSDMTCVGPLACVPSGALADKTGTGNTRVGYETGAFSSVQQSYAVAIGYGAENTASNQVAIGTNGAYALLGPGPALVAATSIAATTFTTTGLVMQSVMPGPVTMHGLCHLTWEQTTAAATVSFGFGLDHVPTDLWVTSKINNAATGAQAVAYTTIGGTTTTITGAATTPGAAATPYFADFDLVLETGGTNEVTVTVYGLTSNASDALVIEPGSYCSWLP